MAPRFVFATTTLAPPRGSPLSEVTLPLMTASCAASGAVKVSVRSAAATQVAGSVANLRTRISCLSCEEESRKGRLVLPGRCNCTDLPKSTSDGDVTALQTSEVKLVGQNSANTPYYLLL